MKKVKVARKRLTAEQRKWCKEYERTTGFDAMIDDYVVGNESFVECAKTSVGWFEDWCIEAQQHIPPIPGDED